MKIRIRQGELTDIPWMTALLRNGCRDGHFSPVFEGKEGNFLTSILNEGKVFIMKLRGEIQEPIFIPANILVAEIANSPASFLILLKEEKEIELHLAATKREFRRKGCFKTLIRHVVNTNDNMRIYSRCYKKSTWAINALKQEGFEITKNGNPIELSFKKAPIE